MTSVKLAAVPAPLAVAFAVAAPGAAQQPMAQQNAPSLYKRVGGYDALAAVTDDFLGKLAGDPQFAKFFARISSRSRESQSSAHMRTRL
jgi:hypothetical protein